MLLEFSPICGGHKNSFQLQFRSSFKSVCLNMFYLDYIKINRYGIFEKPILTVSSSASHRVLDLMLLS